MKVVVAPNAFKGSLTAREAASAMAAGVRRALPDAPVVEVPVADGGDGLVDVALKALNGETRSLAVTGPHDRPITASFCHVPSERLAVIEMALASGLVLVAESERDLLTATSRGVGELIRAAVALGCARIIVGVGGSATNDGGIGMAAALGVRFLNEAGREVAPFAANLMRIRRIDVSSRLPGLDHVRIEAVCDVDNPLCGERGASHVFAPQKGATREEVEWLDAALSHLAAVIASDLGVDVRDKPGAGAGGGLAAGLHAFFGAELRRGIEVILDLVGLEKQLTGAALVLTGEGRMDAQTAFGKGPAGVAAAARRRNIPCFAIVGSVGDDLAPLHAVGIEAVFSLCPGPLSLAEAMADAGRHLMRATEQAVRAFLAGRVA